jgi:hypothetical protein
LGQLDLLRPFYLAGGTALALRLGHRISQDLDLFACSGQKYLHSRCFGMRVLTALVDFDIADQQEEPILLQAVQWEQVKAFFVAQARRLGQDWFGQPG